MIRPINLQLPARSRVYVGAQIPEKLRANAAGSYSVLPASILALCDDTVFGSGKDGIVITADKLLLKESFLDPKVFWWKNIQDLDVHGGAVYVNGNKAHEFSLAEEQAIRALFDALKQQLRGSAAAPQSTIGGQRAAPPILPRPAHPSDMRMNLMLGEVQLDRAQAEKVASVRELQLRLFESFVRDTFDDGDDDEAAAIFLTMLRQHVDLLNDLLPLCTRLEAPGQEIALGLQFLILCFHSQCCSKLPLDFVEGLGRESFYSLVGIGTTYFEHCAGALKHMYVTPVLDDNNEAITAIGVLFGQPENEPPKLDVGSREQLLWKMLLKEPVFQERTISLLFDQSHGILDGWLDRQALEEDL
jgi:hypothetical protein